MVQITIGHCIMGKNESQAFFGEKFSGGGPVTNTEIGRQSAIGQACAVPCTCTHPGCFRLEKLTPNLLFLCNLLTIGLYNSL